MATGIVLGIGWIWFTSMRAKEKSHETARDLCRRMGVELLDDTVALSHMGIKRNDAGRLVLKRVYEFRYLDVDSILRHGTIILSGNTLESCLVDTQQVTH
ncbi:MAG: DUF3301 domain-containing protein [Magnetococcales bacterium]|nr:DUF3301 domain-containing protein [Magnetococcales bacterium]MBF0149213.1 DUF3301 domain-containing protein [Magnetococcales bacterium]MBF0171979.1 DUF3301 domain-containing protein [Magnetococcales bacterium]MBF0349122.1 DUF3301 domain-containing protein [Magnetococcales bacterium]MBF0630561.1 DUF3301 domain-containing protein [Magnetococcales bacterium]